MTTQEFFENLLGRINLGIGDKEREFIQKKQNDLREKLREKLPLKDDFLTGSYARDTILKTKNNAEKFDIDLFVAFDDKDYGTKDLSELHGLVARALNEVKNENANLGIIEIDEEQRRSIGVKFGNNFQIDIVSAIEIERDKLYKIFDKKTLRPVNSNPKLHGSLLSEANKRTGGKLVPIVKMLKSWAREKCDYVKSFHIELLATKILGDAPIKSFSEGLATFFAKATDYLKEPSLKDPANQTLQIDAYLDEDGTRAQLLQLIVAENAVVKKALVLEKSGENAVQEWQKIFPIADFKNDQQNTGATAVRSTSASKGFIPHSPWSAGFPNS